MTTPCPTCGQPPRTATAPPVDGRAIDWRVRVRLYRAARLDTPEADSDPDLPAAANGATICYGLPGVADHLRALADGFHGQPCAGLDQETLRHRLNSLRPTLSRRGGNAVWRVPYTVQPPVRDQNRLAPEHVILRELEPQAWLARVDVERVE